MTQLGRLGTYCFCFNVKRDENGVVVYMEHGTHYPLNAFTQDGDVVILNENIVIRNAVEYNRMYAVHIEGTYNGDPVYVRLGEFD